MFNKHKELIKLVDNPFIATIIIFLVLNLLFLLLTEIWKELFIIMFSFILSDVVCKGFMRGGDGICQFYLFNTKTLSYGVSLLYFAFTITLSTIVANILTNAILKSVFGEFVWLLVPISSFVISICLLADLFLTFHRRKAK